MSPPSKDSIRGHVMFVVASNRRRGAEVFTTQLAAGLNERGWRVEAVSLTSSSDEATVPLEVLTGIGVGDGGRFSIAILRALRRKIRSTSPDVVVAMGGSTLRYAAAAKPASGAQLAYFAIGEPRYWLRNGIAKRINVAFYRTCDRIVAVSAATAAQLIELDGTLQARTSISGTGVDHHFLELSRQTADGERLRVLYVGSLSPEKDPLLAVEAIADSPFAELRMVGSGPLVSDITGALEESAVGDRVILVGAIDDVAAELTQADVLLLTSETEGLPGVILEAAAVGVPCVAVDVGGVKEAIVSGATGLVVPRDKGEIVRGLAALHHDRRSLARMGRAAQERVAKQFLIEHAVERFDGILSEMSR